MDVGAGAHGYTPYSEALPDPEHLFLISFHRPRTPTRPEQDQKFAACTATLSRGVALLHRTRPRRRSWVIPSRNLSSGDQAAGDQVLGAAVQDGLRHLGLPVGLGDVLVL